MVDLHTVMDNLFVRLENTGSLGNTDLMKIVTLSLIDDYRDEMEQCDPSWRRILNDIEASFAGTSCLINH